MSWIYIGTFGSFIGYSAAFPLLLKTQFPAITVAVAFLGPLVGSVARPLGGLLARQGQRRNRHLLELRRDGPRDTMGVIYYVDVKKLFRLPRDVPGPLCRHRHRQRLDLPARAIPSIFREKWLPGAAASPGSRRGRPPLQAASIESAAALGLHLCAVSACGDYLIPRGFTGASIAATGGPHLALGGLPRLLCHLHPGSPGGTTCAAAASPSSPRRTSRKRASEGAMTTTTCSK